MTRAILVHPQHLGRELITHIKTQVQNEVLGEVVKDIGYVIMVLAIDDAAIGKGLIDHMTSRVRYEVQFDAIVFRPFRNEVMDAVCSVCTSQGFFAEAGTFSLFVSRVHIPADMTFRSEDSSWTSNESGLSIKASGSVRLKILGTNSVSRGMSGIGTINEPYLGPIA
jgi:DNA-directed RNA polymerase II subunit RPB7